MKIVYALSLILFASLWMAAPALAQPVADFYRGRTMDFIVGYPRAPALMPTDALWRRISASTFQAIRG
jgi:hypothetical protein